MRIKPFKALFPDIKMVPKADSFFSVMKQEFPYYLKNSFFKRTKEPHLYLYQIEQLGKKSLGLVASTSVEDIKENKILKHENTIAMKEQQMLDLALQRNAMIKPVLLAHDTNKSLKNIYQEILKGKPFLEIPFTEEKSTHKIWKIKDQRTIEKITDIFNTDFKKTYIADGHHRVSTGMLLNQNKRKSKADFGDLLSIYFSFDDLTIYDYNRVVSILKEVSPTELIASLSKYFKMKQIKALRKPREKHEIIFSINGENYQLLWRKKFLISGGSDKLILDARLLNKYVFGEIMGINDVRNDSRISYIGGLAGVQGVKKQLLKNDHSVGFMLYPIQREELTHVADAGSTLPPKSTWFEPRIKNAILAQEFE
ncbi:DUF1015 family protein [Saprospiraceae bacterium]|nr:DUF1015 family protein [Saprospiraceae bacterium]